MIEITICTGTLCHIMGGAELFEIEDKLKQVFNTDIVIKASTCLGICENGEHKKPPCILINNEEMHEADIEKIIKHLKG
jgi:NADH:ubiquinone oxidoreductase subunit E